MVPIAIHPQAATWPKKSAVEKRIMSWKTSFLFLAIEFVMTQSTRYFTGINISMKCKRRRNFRRFTVLLRFIVAIGGIVAKASKMKKPLR